MPSRWAPYAGARTRYGGSIPDAVTAQLDKELALIEELDHPGYFLTMHEVVRWCRERGILCQGRGSAANSAVCYFLGVTAGWSERLRAAGPRRLASEPDLR